MVLVFTLAWSLSVVFTGIRFVIATTVALWYNQECNNSLVRVLKAVYWTLRFHLGTVCFGSLILFLAGVGKVVCQYIITKVPAPAGLQQVHWIISKCLVILVFLAERLIKFFTSQTLTQVALSSESFCTSASEVSKVMSISILKFDFICEFLLLGGKLVISIGSTLISRILLKKGILSESIGSTLSVEFLTLTAIFALSWIVSSMFAYLWSAACDSVITLQAFEKISRNTNYESKLGNTVNDSMDEFAANPDYI